MAKITVKKKRPTGEDLAKMVDVKFKLAKGAKLKVEAPKGKKYKVVIPDHVRKQIESAPPDVQKQILELVEAFKTGKKDPAKVGEPVTFRKLTYEIVCMDDEVKVIKEKMEMFDSTLINDEEYALCSSDVCSKIDVPTTCCALKFGEGKGYDYSEPDFETVRGEQMIIDYDKKGLVMGIELLSSEEAEKRCQTSRCKNGKDRAK